MRTRRFVNYRQYLLSPEWLVQRAAALNRAGRKCQLCSSRFSLRVHHNNYDNLGNEAPEDLVVLCDPCHHAFHRHRDPKTARKMPLHKAPKFTAVSAGDGVEIVVTHDLVKALETGNGGFRKSVILMLGGTWPPVHGWKRKVLGKRITVSQAQLEAELETTRDKNRAMMSEFV